MIYVWNVILIVVYALVLQIYRREKVLKKIFCVLCFIQLTLIIGLRYETGADYRSYTKIYLDIYNLRGSELFHYYYIKEPLFVALAKVVQIFFGKNYLVFHFVIALFTMYFLLRAIWENSNNIFMSLYLYISFCLYYVCMNQVRQMLAISIILYSYQYLKKNNLKKYCIWVLIAAMFHNSALIMLPCYFICKLRFNEKMLWRYIYIAVGVFLGYEFVLRMLSYLPYGAYITNLGYGAERFGISSILNWIYRMGLWILVVWFRKPVLRNISENGKLYHLVSICLVIQTLAIQNNMVTRASTYFYAFFIFLIPEIVQAIKISKNKLAMNLGIYLGFTLIHYLYVQLYYKGTLTYQSIFDVNWFNLY